MLLRARAIVRKHTRCKSLCSKGGASSDDEPADISYVASDKDPYSGIYISFDFFQVQNDFIIENIIFRLLFRRSDDVLDNLILAGQTARAAKGKHSFSGRMLLNPSKQTVGDSSGSSQKKSKTSTIHPADDVEEI